MNEARPLRFAIMYTGTALPAWQMESIRQLLAVPGTKPALLIIEADQAGQPVKPAWLYVLLPRMHLIWRLFVWLYLSRRMRAGRPVDPTSIGAGTPVLRWNHSPARTFRAEDLALIRDYDLDFILYCAEGTPRGRILHTPRFGVWAFVHGDQGQNRESPPCYWEIYHNAPTIRAALVRVGDGIAGDVVLREGVFKTLGYSYARTCDQVQEGTAHWPAQVCRDIQAGAATYLLDTAPSLRARRSAPTDVQTARLLLMLGLRLLGAAFHKLARSEEWNIGIIDAPVQVFLEAGARPPVRWLPGPAAGTFLADPFGIETETGEAILVERFERRSGRGHIALLESRGDGIFSAPLSVIEAPHHLSYPYVVRHEGAVYCIPESGAVSEVTLYKALSFPHRWARHATLIQGFAAKDATVFQHGGLWWLFCSEARHAQNNTLYAWYAPDLCGPWQGHPANPLKIDIRSSRPAGAPFVHAGYLYRPAQDCSRTYGGAITINRVRRLTPDEFEEEPMVTVEPYAHSPYPLGLHTLSTFGHRTIIDGKRERYDVRAAIVMLRRVLPRSSTSA
jgi:hypothetical protein